MTELERCIEFICRLADRAAVRKERSRFGIAHLNDELPRVWSSNYLFANENLAEADAEALAGEADRILGGAGFTHRKVELVDEEAGARLEPGFRELGWTVQCDVLMVVHRKPDRPTDSSQISEVTFEELSEAWAAGSRAAPLGAEEDVVQQLVENKRVVAQAIATRFFAAEVDGQIASYCDLYSDGQTGQIEAVMTLEAYRKRGLARAVVSRALDESRAAGDTMTFLMADRDDWPQELYRKLGFDEIGRIWEFIRPSPK
ncbi:MAG: GNAT family N-acetyltransferase [Actinomycetota bacterium]